MSTKGVSGVAVARAYARYRIRRMVFIGVPRAVLDDRARRGVAGVAGGGRGRWAPCRRRPSRLLPLPGARARQRRLSRPSGWREARAPAPAERRERESTRAARPRLFSRYVPVRTRRSLPVLVMKTSVRVCPRAASVCRVRVCRCSSASVCVRVCPCASVCVRAD